MLGVSITGKMVCDFWTFGGEKFRKIRIWFFGEDTEKRVESFQIYLSLKVYKTDRESEKKNLQGVSTSIFI